MPIVDVTYGPRLGEDAVRRLAAALPHAVSLAVECPEEPYDGELRPGDVELRFHARGPFDPGGLDVVVHVHSTWTESRAADRDARCARLRDAIAGVIGDGGVGVYLALPVAGWAQTDLG